MTNKTEPKENASKNIYTFNVSLSGMTYEDLKMIIEMTRNVCAMNLKKEEP